MPTWTPDNLNQLTTHDEITLAVDRRDGTPGDPVIMWGVSAGDQIFIRAVRGDASPWYRRALVTQAGELQVGSLRSRVRIEPAPTDLTGAIDAAYRSKYARYAANIVGSIVTPTAQAATLTLIKEG